MDQQLHENIRYLGLTKIMKIFDERAEKAAEKCLQPADFAAQLIMEEANARRERAAARRLKHACFPVIKTIDGFNWDEAPSLNRPQIEYLFRLNFIAEKKNIAFIGTPGVGKTHLATALGYHACTHGHSVLFAQAVDILHDLEEAQNEGRYTAAMKKYRTPELLIIDEIGYLATGSHGADLFFQVISERYETGSIIVTSNLAFQDWVKIFDNNTALTGAILDRLLHHCLTIAIKEDSYRMNHRSTLHGNS